MAVNKYIYIYNMYICIYSESISHLCPENLVTLESFFNSREVWGTTRCQRSFADLESCTSNLLQAP